MMSSRAKLQHLIWAFAAVAAVSASAQSASAPSVAPSTASAASDAAATTEPAGISTEAVVPAPWLPEGTTPDALLLDARAAYNKRDVAKLEALRALAMERAHPLASWVHYWALLSRLGSATHDEVQAFFTLWRGRYVEDRLRNDWLLELGRRREWAAFGVEHPRFRMNDDREVNCYALLLDHRAGRDIKAQALDAWRVQTNADEGCLTMARTLLEAKVFEPRELWIKLREAVAQGRLPPARQTAALISPSVADAFTALHANPQKYLDRRPLKSSTPSSTTSLTAGLDAAQIQALDALAIARLASSDPEQAAKHVRSERWALSPALKAWTWSQVARHAGFKLQPAAFEYDGEWLSLVNKLPKGQLELNDEALAWVARTSLRNTEPARWARLKRALALMSPAQAGDAPWRYWRARALIDDAATGSKGDEARSEGRRALRDLAGEFHFYGMLAAEELGEPYRQPAAPASLTAAEQKAAREHAGLKSALGMLAQGLRDEGNREWNYSLRGMTERELLAASQLACERSLWDRCINTSDRTREAIDLTQRYPLPYKPELLAKSHANGLDPALTYGVVRQESRFVIYTRSVVGAGGLMQLMPATAKWTAAKLGVDYKRDRIYEPELNATLGTGYLKMVLDEFGGSQALATAAYNAGPHRARRWREGNNIDAAAWVESIPFNETRDYVKKVLSNAVVYSQLLGQPTSLRQRLGTTIGPAPKSDPAPRADLP